VITEAQAGTQAPRSMALAFGRVDKELSRRFASGLVLVGVNAIGGRSTPKESLMQESVITEALMKSPKWQW
jgi:hypothetical protein